MSELSGEALIKFAELNTLGQAANKRAEYLAGQTYFDEMDQIAEEYGDPLRRTQALNPGARAYWCDGKYDEAYARLWTAAEMGMRLDCPDEVAIAMSNMGRLATHRIIKQVAFVEDQAEVLRREAMPSFMDAYKLLQGHPHFYYRYANAQHGSLVAALADEPGISARLIRDGLAVAPRKSPGYDNKATYRINNRGMLQLGAATLLLAGGSRTPILANKARQVLTR